MTLRISKSIVFCLLIVSINSCALFKPYEAELGQGNFIRDEKREQLAIGQTQAQVAFLLGTPQLTGEFPRQRWIYPTYSDDTGYQELIIEFTDGTVSAIEQRPKQ